MQSALFLFCEADCTIAASARKNAARSPRRVTDTSRRRSPGTQGSPSPPSQDPPAPPPTHPPGDGRVPAGSGAEPAPPAISALRVALRASNTCSLPCSPGARGSSAIASTSPSNLRRNVSKHSTTDTASPKRAARTSRKLGSVPSVIAAGSLASQGMGHQPGVTQEKLLPSAARRASSGAGCRLSSPEARAKASRRDAISGRPRASAQCIGPPVQAGQL